MRLHYWAALLGAASLCSAADWKPADNPLTTPWTSKVTAAHALPEYPRPQMVRAKWTNLNGLWDYAITAQDGGAARGVRRPASGAVSPWNRRSRASSAR